MVVPAPGVGRRQLVRARASAVLVDGTFWLTWRVRRPLTEGRGVAVVVARSSDGVTLRAGGRGRARGVRLPSPSSGRSLVPVPGVGWRLYLSCATPGSKHWWVDSLTARPRSRTCRPAASRWCCPGDDTVGGQGPRRSPTTSDGWQMWLCCHPLDEPGHEDRMTTRLPDQRRRARLDRPRRGAGRAPGPVGRPRRPGRPPCIGQRPAHRAVRRPGRRRVQLARDHRRRRSGTASRLVADAEVAPIASPYSDGAFRYASRGAAGRRADPLLRRGRPRRRRARPGDVRPLAPGSASAASLRSRNEPRLSVDSQSSKDSPVSCGEQGDVVGEVRQQAGPRLGRTACGRTRVAAGHPPAISGALARRHTCGGANWPAQAPARSTRPSTAGRRPGLDEAAAVVVRDRRRRVRARSRGSGTPGRPRPGGSSTIVAVAQHQHALPVDVAEQVGELLAVPAELARSARTAPSLRRSARARARTPPRSRPPARARRTTGASSCCRRGRWGRAPPRSAGRGAAARRSGAGRRGARGRTACSRRARTRPARRRRAARSRRAARPTPAGSAGRPGPRQCGGGASSHIQYFGSFGEDMKTSGWRVSAACSAVVPAFGAPRMRKSGRAGRFSRSSRAEL